MRVTFRKYNNSDDIIAIFDSIADNNNNNLLCYEHMGQHSACGNEFILDNTVSTNNYDELYNELLQIGYDDLKIVHYSEFKKVA